ncbi:hypothetical protein L6452_20739 [Arctium lappa]|uniref:Uncharacterized protein n=1 Tax=Arctium lappa TaxID=4217 RepID=A0ACB9BBC7_ARCLA|nr:hypothetical protein L6452_20739 [Arctium lappa]
MMIPQQTTKQCKSSCTCSLYSMTNDTDWKESHLQSKLEQHEKQQQQSENCRKSCSSRPKLFMAKAQMMNMPDPYYQKYGCKTWKPENSDTEQSNWQRKLGISSFDPATQKEQEAQAQRNFLEAYVRPDKDQLGVKLHKSYASGILEILGIIVVIVIIAYIRGRCQKPLGASQKQIMNSNSTSDEASTNNCYTAVYHYNKEETRVFPF